MGCTDLSSPFEDEGEFSEMSDFAAGLSLRVDGLKLGLCAGELDLAGEGLVELSQLIKIVANGPETLCFFDRGSDLDQLFALPKDNFFCFIVEETNEGLSPLFVNGEVELEFLLWGTISVSEDGHVGLEDPGGGFWGGIYGERTLGRSRETTETDAR